MTAAATDSAWLSEQLAGLTIERQRLKVSEWAEQKRYLPTELTTHPGFWDNNYAPYLTEIMDRLSSDDPTRKIAVMKGAQIGATTGLLENAIGYWIDHDPSGILYVSADKELTRMGMTMKVDRMLHHSGLQAQLGAPDSSTKRSGDTATLKEFPGGFLLGVGARNPGKLRSTSAKRAVLDELDGMPQMLGGVGTEEGNPVNLIEKRTDSYSLSRKILYLSTPLKLQTSLIYPLFKAGDQRHYFIPCRHCGEMQPLEWHGVGANGKAYGIQFVLEKNGKLIEETVGYACKFCAQTFFNHDKAWFLPRGEWRAASETTEEGLTSYHVPAMLSPPGMYPWSGIVNKWLKAWDVENDRVRDRDALQTFYNLERGLPWEERGSVPSFERVREHRRQCYLSGEIRNDVITKETGAPGVLVTSAVDVHESRLDVEVLLWAQGRQSYSLEWLHFEGDTDDLSPGGPWEQLRLLLVEKEWAAADSGHVYRIQTTLIDQGYKSDIVHQFCQQFSGGVYPVQGRPRPIQGSTVREFAQAESATGNIFYNCTATMYKDRLAAWLRMDWIGEGGRQPDGYPNYPRNYGDAFFRQYEAEERVEIRDRVTKQRRGFRWQPIGQRPNHAWDCRVYNMCAYDLIVHETCLEILELAKIDYDKFAEYATPRRNESGLWVEAPFAFHPAEVPL